MWLILLRKYWLPLAIVSTCMLLLGFLHHKWYTAGYQASQVKIAFQHESDLDNLRQRETKAIDSLHKAEQALDREKTAKVAALAEASKTPKILVKTVTVHDQTCPNISIDDSFERVWNAQTKAAATGH